MTTFALSFADQFDAPVRGRVDVAIARPPLRWIFVLLSYIGVTMAFPGYLVTRERYLAKHAPAADPAVPVG